jgi:hypothetical protein
LFSANSNGQGVPAASVLRVRGDAQLYEPVARYDAQRNSSSEPIDLGQEGDQVFRILFGTGIRAAAPPGQGMTATKRRIAVRRSRAWLCRTRSGKLALAAP